MGNGKIHVFDMLRRGTLETMNEAMLVKELDRVEKMLDAVDEYRRLVAEVIAGKGKYRIDHQLAGL